jgi:hypothetical protein
LALIFATDLGWSSALRKTAVCANILTGFRTDILSFFNALAGREILSNGRGRFLI